MATKTRKRSPDSSAPAEADGRANRPTRRRPPHAAAPAAGGEPEPAAPAIAPVPEPPLPPKLRAMSTALDTLTPDPKNARTHDETNMAAVRASLARFGWAGLVIARESDRVVIAGNARVAAARSMGWKHAPVLFVPFDDAASLAFAIADNRTAELAAWNRDQLLANLRELELEDDNLLDATGFSIAELDEMKGLDAASRERVDDPPPPGPTKSTVRKGDLWHLGNHRLLCGDSTNIEHVLALLAGERAALCSTDPPYLVDYTGADRPGGTGKDWSGDYREIDIKDAGAFFRAVWGNVVQVLQPHAALYCWHAHKRCGEIQTIWRDLGILDHQQIIWVKPAPVFGRVYWHFRHEPCVMGWVQGSKPRYSGTHEFDSVWEIDYRRAGVDAQPPPAKPAKGKRARRGDEAEREQHDSVWRLDWEGKSRVIGNEHPTQKPVEIFARPIRAHTDPGEIVFEPFSGSGSQLIAAEMTGRHCRAMEISPAFVDAAVRRWESLTGKKAKRERIKLES